MTKQEFQNRTGCTLTDEAFNKINLCLTQAKGVTPETFCAEFSEYPDVFLNSVVLINLAENAALLEEANAKQRQSFDKMKAALLQAAIDADAEETWEKVTAVLGPVHVIRFKLDNQLELTDADRAYIIGHLKEGEI